MKTKGIVLGVVILAVLGFVGYAAGMFSPHETPNQLLSASYLNKLDAGYRNANVDITLKQKSEAGAVYKDAGTFHVVAKTNGGQTLQNASLDMTFDGTVIADDSGSPFSKIDLGGEFLVVNKLFYIKLTKLPMIPIFDPATVKDKWWSVDAVDLARRFSGEDKAKEIEAYLNSNPGNSAADIEKVKSLLAENNFISNPHFTETAKVDGHAVKNISFTIDKVKLASFLKEFLTYAQAKKDSTAKPVALADIQKGLDMITFTPITVGASPDDHRIYTLTGGFEVLDPETQKGLMVTFSEKMDYDTPVTITAPASSQSIEKLLQKLFMSGAPMGAGKSK